MAESQSSARSEKIMEYKAEKRYFFFPAENEKKDLTF